jgi:hypothetical protein
MFRVPGFGLFFLYPDGYEVEIRFERPPRVDPRSRTIRKRPRRSALRPGK